jgi:hypothetical protein
MLIKYLNGVTPLLNSAVHRLFWNCPICGFQVADDKEYEVWLAEANLREVIMHDYKVDCIIAVSECPKCRGLSYTHYDLGCVIHACQVGRLKLDLKTLQLERARRLWTISGIWATNKCKECAHLKTLERHEYAVTAECEDGGWSRVGTPPNQCERFRSEEPPEQVAWR